MHSSSFVFFPLGEGGKSVAAKRAADSQQICGTINEQRRLPDCVFLGKLCF